ncbi:DUF2642 domain-containing protein [Peribacillus asahii]|mgnify:CR=1 FL=1|uniref:DUF2642 domain-containing protein n=1 Tax=Peribacillus asahii TaxID=228899 RepID=A0A398BC63_9BACI|nr:DUF2642 domain-containing protein [Peribacillus asahii]RID85243.1 DUF2642 domain-containing protein [Peribacillus asahii]
MTHFDHLIGKIINVEISGKIEIFGQLIDAGLDILVLYNGQYFYIPIVHIQRVKLDTQNILELAADFQPEQPITTNSDSISFRKILTNAKGTFVQIYIEGNKTIHGYLTSIMNDYFVFYSPAYKVMFISMNHLKWLIPYSKNSSPYSLNNKFLPVNPTSISLARSFTEQCKKLENNIVILDGGDHPEKIGLLQKVQDQQLTLVTAEEEIVYWNCQHLKTIHLP